MNEDAEPRVRTCVGGSRSGDRHTAREGTCLVLPHRVYASRWERYTAKGDYLQYDGKVDARGLPMKRRSV